MEVMLELKKAFDTVDHDVLLKKSHDTELGGLYSLDYGFIWGINI